MEALGELGSGETIEQLNSLLRFPDASVKKEIMKYLAKTNTPQSRIMLIEQLKDKDKEVVTETIRLLGEIKCAEAAGELIKLLASPKCESELKEALCVVLGTIGDPQAVPYLIVCLKNKGFWNLGRRTETERVRVRAAWALRKFKGREIEEALEAAAGDKSSPVALTAKESLNIIKTN